MLVLQTLAAIGPLHGYRLARRIEQISDNQLTLNQGTLYPALLKLEQMEWIVAKWGESESGRRVKIYSLTKTGRSSWNSRNRGGTGQPESSTASSRFPKRRNEQGRP